MDQLGRRGRNVELADARNLKQRIGFKRDLLIAVFPSGRKAYRRMSGLINEDDDPFDVMTEDTFDFVVNRIR